MIEEHGAAVDDHYLIKPESLKEQTANNTERSFFFPIDHPSNYQPHQTGLSFGG